MPTVQEVRAAFANALELRIPLFRWHDQWPANLQGPCGVIRRLTSTYTVDFDGHDDCTYGITLYIPLTDYHAAQNMLDDLVAGDGALSVQHAIEADDTLAHMVEFLDVQSCQEEGAVEIAGVQYLSATIRVNVGGA